MQFEDSVWGNLANSVFLSFSSHLSWMTLVQNQAGDTEVYSTSWTEDSELKFSSDSCDCYICSYNTMDTYIDCFLPLFRIYAKPQWLRCWDFLFELMAEDCSNAVKAVVAGKQERTGISILFSEWCRWKRWSTIIHNVSLYKNLCCSVTSEGTL